MILNSVFSNLGDMVFQPALSDIDFENPKSLSDAFKTLIRQLEIT
jgi:hypothetical protein